MSEAVMVAKAPETVIWLVTHRCNLRCRHCYAIRYSRERELGEEGALKAVKLFAEAGVEHIHITGGEPLLWAPLWRVLDEAEANGLGASLFTNATLLPVKPGLAAKIAAHVTKVYTSLDGPTADIHDTIRGAGSFRRATHGVRLLVKEGVRVHVNMSVTELNWAYVKATLRKALELGASNVSIIPAMPAGRAAETGVWVRPSSFMKALMQAAEFSEEEGVEVGVWCAPFLAAMRLPGKLRYGNCRDWSVMDVTPAGNVVTCDVLGEVVANILEDGVEGAWRKLTGSSVLRSVSRAPPECAGCPVAGVCRGGCYARSRLLKGRYNARDPLCPLTP